jgi:hypothetical protein
MTGVVDSFVFIKTSFISMHHFVLLRLVSFVRLVDWTGIVAVAIPNDLGLAVGVKTYYGI